MNKDRRKSLTALLPDLDRIKTTLEQIRDEEQEAYDAMPEGFQQSQRGQDSEEAIYMIEQCIDGIESAQDNINEITSR